MIASASAPPSSSSSSGAEFGGLRHYNAMSTTGLAVAATCKRMKVFSRLDPAKGVVTLDAKEISRCGSV